MKVCKFGGSSMASGETIKKVADIIRSDERRKYIVVSAPGKRFKEDIKITDSLLNAYAECKKGKKLSSLLQPIFDRFNGIAKDLGIEDKVDLAAVFEEIEAGVVASPIPDYAAAQGERLSAMLLAAYLGYEFLDAREIIRFADNGQFNAEYTNDLARKRLQDVTTGVVIPGFYGSTSSGQIRTFSRGGSDVTGAIIARAVKAEIYENWTDVNGFLTADPRIVENPKPIPELSYRELRELSYMGANVLHPESIFPVRKANIPINIKNTFDPENPGTMILPGVLQHERLITGIAGKKGFVSILIEKSMMNNEIGFTRKLLSVLENLNMSFEHLPSGIDTMTLIIADTEIGGKLQDLVGGIREAVSPDRLEIQSDLALIATVGHGMAYKPGTASRLFTALSRVGVNIKMIDQGSSELNIIVAVSGEDYEKAINAIYEEFIN
ncbi:MAG TPA: aspartate kinase [Clostridiales bacterium]|nr:aspartate kinase [Clostridiales bacterium]